MGEYAYHPPRSLIGINIDILIQLLQRIIPSPILRFLKLAPSRIRIESTRTKKPPIQIPSSLASSIFPIPFPIRKRYENENIQHRRIPMTRLLPLLSLPIIPILLTYPLKLLQFPLLLRRQMVQVAREPLRARGLRRGRGGVIVMHGFGVLVLVGGGFARGAAGPEGHFCFLFLFISFLGGLGQVLIGFGGIGASERRNMAREDGAGLGVVGVFLV